jgi:hypothetical protein
MQGAAGGGDFLLNMVIRPPRNEYPDDSHQNNKTFTVNGVEFVKKVFQI